MNDWLRRLLPTPEALSRNRWLRWIGPALHHPRLWHMSRRGIALGVALGIFFGLLVPIAQIPLAAAAAVLMRANLPTAVASTLVTNPVTFGPVYYAAWRVGNAVLGGPAGEPPAPTVADAAAEAEAADAADESWFERAWRRISGVGKPLLLGLAIFAAVGGLLSYLLVSGAWHLKVRLQRRRRRRRQGGS
ncbi:MAG: DUF2062 domain-containing protein [Piscinibacter sp.]|uniref:DUF2062 domain-containing protein n=1 Tax=Piscinibacter sp. TaxID=1903157 RepID=UPI002586CFD4|nr:DUF2062 domain-containing protein [Piscinibacter sp.]MCW5663060.1 DUF2062 domain-containing protein [Piscinibacter sp.]